MDFPKDGGLSCVRYFLLPAVGDALEALAREASAATSGVAGRLRCQCDAEDFWGVRGTPTALRLICGCNGSVLPVHLAEMPPTEMNWWYHRCFVCRGERHTVAIGIGYPHAEVPAMGTLEAERATALAVALQCTACLCPFIVWQRRLPEPPVLDGKEPWLAGVQAFSLRR